MTSRVFAAAFVKMSISKGKRTVCLSASFKQGHAANLKRNKGHTLSMGGSCSYSPANLIQTGIEI